MLHLPHLVRLPCKCMPLALQMLFLLASLGIMQAQVAVVTMSPQQDTTACNGTYFTIAVSASSLSQPVIYNWQVYRPIAGAWVSANSAPFSGHQTATLSVFAQDTLDGFSFRCLVTDAISSRDTSPILALSVALGPLSVASPDTSICRGEVVTLTASASGSAPPFVYAWQGLGSHFVLHAAPPHTQAFYLSVTDSNGCIAHDSVIVTVFPNPLIDLGPDRLICEHDSMSVTSPVTNGTPPYQGTWYPGGVGLQTTILLGSSQAVLHTVEDAHGCRAQDQIFVTVVPKPIAYAGINQIICHGDTAFLMGHATGPDTAFSYNWMQMGVQGAVLNFVPTSDQSLQLLVSDGNGCSDSDTVMISVNAVPAPMIIGPDTVCGNQSGVPFEAGAGLDSTSSISWQSSGGGGFEGLVNESIITYHFPTGPRMVHLFLSAIADSSGCLGTDTLHVQVLTEASPDPATFFFLAPNILVCRDSTAASYQWGYDSAGASITIPGAVQSFIIPVPFDTVARHYWVITSFQPNGQGCVTRSYYGHLMQAESTVLHGSFLQVFPNPAKSRFTITWEVTHPGAYQLQVLDACGKLIMEENGKEQMGKNDLPLELEAHVSGVYMARLTRTLGASDAIKFVLMPRF